MPLGLWTDSFLKAHYLYFPRPSLLTHCETFNTRAVAHKINPCAKSSGYKGRLKPGEELAAYGGGLQREPLTRSAFAVSLKAMPWKRKPRVHGLLCSTGVLPAPCHMGHALRRKGNTKEMLLLPDNGQLEASRRMKRCHLLGIKNISGSPPGIHASCQAARSHPSAPQWEKAQTHQPQSYQGGGRGSCYRGVAKKIFTASPQRPMADE